MPDYEVHARFANLPMSIAHTLTQRAPTAEAAASVAAVYRDAFPEAFITVVTIHLHYRFIT